jgi:hypothetical protein
MQRELSGDKHRCLVRFIPFHPFHPSGWAEGAKGKSAPRACGTGRGAEPCNTELDTRTRTIIPWGYRCPLPLSLFPLGGEIQFATTHDKCVSRRQAMIRTSGRPWCMDQHGRSCWDNRGALSIGSAGDQGCDLRAGGVSETDDH